MQEGTVDFFLDTPGRRHGLASVPKIKEKVFLPAAHMKVAENGTLREFQSGEEKQYPQPGTKVIVEVQDGKYCIASRWAVIP